MRGANSGNEILLSKYNVPGEIRPQQGHIPCSAKRDAGGQHGSKTHDVVAPEHAFDFGQVGFVQVSAVAGRLQVDAANLDVQRVFLGSDDQVGAVGAQLAADLVADIGGHGDHGGGHSHAQHDGNSGQQLAALLPPEGLIE